VNLVKESHHWSIEPELRDLVLGQRALSWPPMESIAEEAPHHPLLLIRLDQIPCITRHGWAWLFKIIGEARSRGFSPVVWADQNKLDFLRQTELGKIVKLVHMPQEAYDEDDAVMDLEKDMLWHAVSEVQL
jgi:hypothetical protein